MPAASGATDSTERVLFIASNDLLHTPFRIGPVAFSVHLPPRLGASCTVVEALQLEFRCGFELRVREHVVASVLPPLPLDTQQCCRLRDTFVITVPGGPVELPVMVGDITEDSEVCCWLRSRHREWRAVIPLMENRRLVVGVRDYPLVGEGQPAASPPPLRRHSSSYQDCASDGLLSGLSKMRELHEGQMAAIPWLDTITEGRLRELHAEQQQKTPSEFIQVLHCPSDRPFPILRWSEETGMQYAAGVVPSSRPAEAVLREAWRRKMSGAPQELCLTASSTRPYRDLLLSSGSEMCRLYENQAALLSAAVFAGDVQSSPDPQDRRRLQHVLALPPLPLAAFINNRGSGAQVAILRPEEVALLWRWRRLLCGDGCYFVPFLRSCLQRAVDGSSTAVAVSLTPASSGFLQSGWKSLSLSDIFACLSPTLRGHVELRRVAIRHLETHIASNPALLRRLAVPLVHAVRYDSRSHRELERFLVSHCLVDWELCSIVYWTVKVESEVEAKEREKTAGSDGDASAAGVFEGMRVTLSEQLRGLPEFIGRLHAQERVAHSLATLADRLINYSTDRSKRMARGKKRLEEGAYGFATLFSGNYVRLPSHPAVIVTGVRGDGFYVFKSAMMPMRVVFTTSSSVTAEVAATSPSSPDAAATLSVMVKREDMRQDALVMSLLLLMDDLLQQEGFQLHLTPYVVQPIGAEEGLVELVSDVVTFESIKRDVHAYWRRFNSTHSQFTAALQRYVRSLAGYSVVTYVLGVGDRHLENILMTSDGRLLHIDFGYIFGHDPKPFVPAMKLTSEMVTALGGPQSKEFHDFKTACCGAYNVLRRHAALLLYTLAAFSDAPQMPQMDEKALLGVQERLRLDLTNTQATQFMLNVITGSVNSLVAPLWDVIHSTAQAARE